MINSLLKQSGIKERTAYTTGEVSKILDVSTTTIIYLCNNYSPKIFGLEYYKVGSHRRIPHHAIVDYLERSK